LYEARRGFQTNLLQKVASGKAIAIPPSQLFAAVDYDSDVGKLAAYLTPDPRDGGRHPAVIWLGGDDCNSIGDVWHQASADNDQTAAAFREAGIVMMFPSLRGGNTNPAYNEALFGEVDDVLAAADFLAGQRYVDSKRIYLGGHNLGGTLALLVAESSDRFRVVFAFGPATTGVIVSARGFVPYPHDDIREVAIRSPGFWLHSIRTPVFVLEGIQLRHRPGLMPLPDRPQNPLVHFLRARNASDNSLLAPATQLIAQKIVQDTEPETNLSIGIDEINQLFDGPRVFLRPAEPGLSTPPSPPAAWVPGAAIPKRSAPPRVDQPMIVPSLALPVPAGPPIIPRAGPMGRRGLPPGRARPQPMAPPRGGAQPGGPQSPLGGL
jgi:hypothetical protein